MANSEVQYPVTIDPIIEIVNDDYNFSYEAKTYLEIWILILFILILF